MWKSDAVNFEEEFHDDIKNKVGFALAKYENTQIIPFIKLSEKPIFASCIRIWLAGVAIALAEWLGLCLLRSSHLPLLLS